MPRTDPSRSDRVGQSREQEDRQRRERQSRRDVDPDGERTSRPTDTPEDEI